MRAVIAARLHLNSFLLPHSPITENPMTAKYSCSVVFLTQSYMPPRCPTRRQRGSKIHQSVTNHLLPDLDGPCASSGGFFSGERFKKHEIDH